MKNIGFVNIAICKKNVDMWIPFRSRPNVWRVMMKAGLKWSSFLPKESKIWLRVSAAAENKRFSSFLSYWKNWRSFSAIVRTTCRCGQSRTIDLMVSARWAAYLTPQELQNLDLQEWGTILKSWQCGHSKRENQPQAFCIWPYVLHWRRHKNEEVFEWFQGLQVTLENDL